MCKDGPPDSLGRLGNCGKSSSQLDLWRVYLDLKNKKCTYETITCHCDADFLHAIVLPTGVYSLHCAYMQTFRRSSVARGGHASLHKSGAKTAKSAFVPCLVSPFYCHSVQRVHHT